MKNVFKNIIALTILGIAIYIFRGTIQKSYFIVQDKYFPCTRTISYSIGTVDEGFGLSKKEFLAAISDSENMWEASINKDLFVYKPQGGELVINLVYDKRQKNTQILKNINDSINDNQGSYNSLKSQVDNLKNEFEQKKLIFDSKIISLKDRKGRYSQESITEINNLQIELNNYVNRINPLVDQLNKSASSVNGQVNEYNNVGDELGDEFEEGLYHSDKTGKYIDIYQFENKNKLERVLMHELGHALSLEHIDNPDAIMYQFNTASNLEPNGDDIEALKLHCAVR
ncbi:MAG: matrixin family metalloprotease [bacterium]